MKLLVFAHTPPPHHGQSYMVQLLLDGFGGDRRRKPAAPTSPLGIECYHVNARVSKQLEDIGDFRPGKLLLLIGYCLEAIYVRFRYGVENFYYVPAPGKSSALYRDWLVMFLCRPFFKRTILHWHAAGLAKWLETARQMRSRAWTYRFLKNVDLSIVLSRYNRGDAEKLLPQRVAVVSNAIPDPCPQFEQAVLPRRHARLVARRKLLTGQPLTPADLVGTGGDPQVFRVLYLAHCTREKGLFDTVEGFRLAASRLQAAGTSIRMQLTVAGEFVDAAERAEFDQLCHSSKRLNSGHESEIHYVGFAGPDLKRRLFSESDCFCFPTYYLAESFGLVVVEAMAYGLPVVSTRWRSLPELFPDDYPGLVDIRAPDQIAKALLGMMQAEPGESFREGFVRRFTLERHLGNMANALRSVESDASAVAPAAWPSETAR